MGFKEKEKNFDKGKYCVFISCFHFQILLFFLFIPCFCFDSSLKISMLVKDSVVTRITNSNNNL